MSTHPIADVSISVFERVMVIIETCLVVSILITNVTVRTQAMHTRVEQQPALILVYSKLKEKVEIKVKTILLKIDERLLRMEAFL